MTNSSARPYLRVCVILIGLVALATFGANPSAQGQAGSGPAETHASRFLWQHIPGTPPPMAANGADPAVRPRRFSAMTLDRGGIAALMAGAPREFTPAARRQPLVVSLPTPGGGFERFAMRESPVMEPGLAARHPDIKTYSGRGIDDPSATIRADVTPLGFHASIRGPRGAWYIDPYYRQDDGLYVSYYGRDLQNPGGVLAEPGTVPAQITVDRGYYHPADAVQLSGAGFLPNEALIVTISGPVGGPVRVIDLQSDEDGAVHTTFVADPLDDLGTHTVEASDGTSSASVTYDVVSPDDQTVDPPVGDQLRTYRLALLTDPGYATYFGAANVTAAKVTLINRVTQVYEEETSIRLVLIAGNDALNLNTDAQMTGANGPCGGAACFTAGQASSCTGGTLTRTRQVIGLIVGASAFDVGHIALGKNGGGLASLGVVGGSNKAQGCTGIPTPVGDVFAVDYVAHEMGHQFAGNHTFNGVTSNCSGGNRNASTSVEPASGSSIMAYAGICGSDNLQPHSDPYWSAKSADEIINYTSSAETNINEVQMAALTNFDGTDSFQLQYNGNLSAAIARGVNFTTAGVQTAIQGVAGWPAGATVTVTALSDTTFTVTFGGTLAGVDVSQLALVNCSGCTGFVGEIARGGPTTRRGAVAGTGNNYPVVTAPAAYTIPIQTPFALTGSAVDPDGDPLTYMWEQTDRGGSTGTGLVNNTKTNGPLFRQFGTAAIVSSSDTLLYDSPGENHTTTNPTRVFPDLSQILINNTNAETGACPVASNPPTAQQIDCFSEFLPTSEYVGLAGVNDSPLSLHFRLTARDGRGGVNSGATTLLLAPGAGPFLVTSPNTAVTLDGGVSQTITWNPANTAAAPVSAANVTISMSTDGGLTYPYTLAASTPNDGSAAVVIPNVATSTARVKIEAVDNVFFDVSNVNFTIVKTQTITFAPIANRTYGDPDFTISASASSGLPVSFTAAGNCTVSGTTVHITGAGSCSITAHQPGDASTHAAPDVTQTFSISTAILEVKPSPFLASRQYSDPNPAFTAVITGFVNGEGVGALTTVPTCASVAGPSSGPGTYAIVCAGGVATNYDFSYINGTLTVTAEDAEATYTGDMLVFTPPSGTVAAVQLRATLRDSSLLAAFADTWPGDIRRATVTFKEGSTTLCSGLAVSLIDGATTTGTASCSASLGLGAHTIDVIVGGWYAGHTAGVVEVAQPNGSFVTGGGYQFIGTSRGIYPADSGSRMNFGLNVQYNGNLKSLKGHVNLIFRAAGREYQIKSNSIDSLGIALRTTGGAACSGPPSPTCVGLADFRSKANLADVTDPLNAVSLGGNLTLRVTMTDKGEPGSADTLGVTLWDGSTLLFSSEWTGTQTIERLLGGGNLVVH